MSIMLSISALFSCSLKNTWKRVGHDFTLTSSLHSQSDTVLTSVIVFCILSSCSVLLCLIVFDFCTSHSF